MLTDTHLDIPLQLQTILQDITQDVEIKSRYCIQHPSYKPLELPSETVTRFEQLPIELQNKFLKVQLSNFLYGIYYNGALKTSLAPDQDDTSSIAKNLVAENNTFLNVDVAFYARLHESNQGDGYYSYHWQVVKEEEDGALAVNKNGLTLHVERDVHLLSEHKDAHKDVRVGDLVAVKLPKNLVQNGFYMAVGNASQSHENITRAYFNLTPDGAVAVMESLTTQLNAINIPFSFKALYNPSDYIRHDSAVLYFNKNDYEAVHSVLARVYKLHYLHFEPEVPLFTKCIAPGLAIAEEPEQKFAEKESFGMNRCQIVANGLFEAWSKGDNSSESRMYHILEQFYSTGIKLQHPYLNVYSEDIYLNIEP